jgi:hypothetical protein
MEDTTHKIQRQMGRNIRMDLRKIEWEGVDWIHLTQDRAVLNMVMNIQVS